MKTKAKPSNGVLCVWPSLHWRVLEHTISACQIASISSLDLINQGELSLIEGLSTELQS